MGSPGKQGSSNGSGLNTALVVAAVVLVLAAAALAWLMNRTYDNRADAVGDGGVWSVISIERADASAEARSGRAGEDVGGGTVQAMDPAPKAEQERTAAQIEAATAMADAFLNLQYDEIETDIEEVKSLATGAFLRQYTKASEDLAKLTRRAQATQTGEVDWAGLVAGDDDSATVIVATSGTVANKLTEFEPVARTYRLQLEIDLVDGQWLTSDLQYVR
ncbi:hypothetical protein DJ010_06365 [Nocardioides silvaticus]|uniref:Mce-associated membrane protein n=1 Tax=Nocardioides silvaticus TaxID=2201891 RepID=A0A316TN58_9ACTN|nr:hypothetical protein [Nocardioides silvaticus]PWN03702.1 hypothetical protein DJ010_06365 [Nocardioides silvaticus]